ncbi:hypothetical protein GOV14_05395 [Candidatus Pacearchaeota archaeon]|nr:hypothetical protein [Candidatus Pacearchaeota archaeon]
MNPISNLELKRKLLHMIVGIISLVLIIYNIITPVMLFFILLCSIILSLIYKRYKIPIIHYFLKNFEREKDLRELPARALIFTIAGTLLVWQLFPKNIALASITILAFADPLSHLIGKVFGKTNSIIDKQKNIEGPIAAALISALIAMLFVPFYLAFPAALASMLFELINIKIQDIELDDNLIIPLTAGITMFLILRYVI